MVQKKQSIPNPNRISDIEKDFLGKTKSVSKELIKQETKKIKYNGRMVSMPDNFFLLLNNYLAENPTEGNRSSFIVRVVAEYIERKKY